VPLAPLIEQLPADYRLAIRDAALFEQSLDYESALAAFGTVEQALRLTYGVVALREGIVCSEAATGAPTHGRIELGVTTAEAHRRRGLASSTCARLIEICEVQGYRTWWDCAKQNTPSVRLARKLGYHEEREYRYVYWRKR
jgi:RimJ/RimL family protein N-acetyltransferase